MNTNRLTLTLTLALLALATAPHAEDIHWNQEGTGPWETAANWNPQTVPGATDEAIVLNGGTAQVGAPGAVANGVHVRHGALEVLADGELTTGRGRVGGADGGILHVAGGRWNLSSLEIGCHGGADGLGELRITEGGQVFADAPADGHAIGQIEAFAACAGYDAASGDGAALVIEGAGSRLEAVGTFNLGGSVNILDGGSLEVFDGNILQPSRGRVRVDGPGSVLASTTLDSSFGGHHVVVPMTAGIEPSITLVNGGVLRMRVNGGGPGALSLGRDFGGGAALEDNWLHIGEGGTPGILDVAYIRIGSGRTTRDHIVFDHDAAQYHLSRSGDASGDPVALDGAGIGAFRVYQQGPGTTVLRAPSDISTLNVTDGRMVFDGNTVAAGQLVVGVPDAQGTLDILNAAVVASGLVRIGTISAGGGPAFLRIDGAETRLSSAEFLVRRTGSVTLSNGAHLSVAQGINGNIRMGLGAAFNIGAASGQPPQAPGRVDSDFIFDSALFGNEHGGLIVFNHDAGDYVFSDTAQPVQIDESYRIRHEHGDTLMALPNSHALGTTIAGGTLRSMAEGAGSALGTGQVLIEDGGRLVAFGNAPYIVVQAGGALEVASELHTGTLHIGSGGFLDLDLDDVWDSGSNDVLYVAGDLTLNGSLRVGAGPAFGPGTYAIIHYSGALDADGLHIVPPYGYEIAADTTQPGLVRLVATQLPAYSVGGTVSGLNGAGLVLQNNGGDDLDIDTDGPFAFATHIVDGDPYAVTIASHPAGQQCAVSQGTGHIAGAAVSDVAVSCVDFPLHAAPGLLAFSVFWPGEASNVLTVTVQNTGDTGASPGPALLDGSDAGDFEIVTDDCTGSTLAPDATCTLEVRFVPTAPGPQARHAWLRVPAQGWLGSLDVELRGEVLGVFRDGFDESAP